jgi:hypothetical protein
MSLSGVELIAKPCSGKEKYVVDISKLVSGSYMIRLTAGEKVFNQVILIMK